MKGRKIKNRKTNCGSAWMEMTLVEQITIHFSTWLSFNTVQKHMVVPARTESWFQYRFMNIGDILN